MQLGLFIEKAKEVSGKRSRLFGSQLYIRCGTSTCNSCFSYFYMVRMWGDVPLITYSYDNGSFPKVLVQMPGSF